MAVARKRQDPLPALAVEINAAHRAAYGHAQEAMEQAAECGRLLLEAKKLVGHGEWLPWLKANTEVDPRQSQKYMQLAKRWPEIESKCEAGFVFELDAALKLVAKPKPKPKAAIPKALCDLRCEIEAELEKQGASDYCHAMLDASDGRGPTVGYWCQPCQADAAEKAFNEAVAAVKRKRADGPSVEVDGTEVDDGKNPGKRRRSDAERQRDNFLDGFMIQVECLGDLGDDFESKVATDPALDLLTTEQKAECIEAIENAVAYLLKIADRLRPKSAPTVGRQRRLD